MENLNNMCKSKNIYLYNNIYLNPQTYVKFRNSLSLRTGAVNKELQYVTTTFPVPSQDCIGNADMLFGNIEIILSHTEAFAFPHRKCEPWKLNAYQSYWVCSGQKRYKGRKLSDNQIGTKVSAKKQIGIQIQRYTYIFIYM